MRPRSIYEAVAKARCNEAKAVAVIFGLEAEAILRTSTFNIPMCFKNYLD